MYQWFPASGGAIPMDADPNGQEANTAPLFVVRAIVDGGLHPGKIGFDFGAANIPFGGQELKISDYDVLVNLGQWKNASGGLVPESGVVVGHETNGTPLFAARALFEGGHHPGKVRLEFGGAHIPFGGREIQGLVDYEVLVEGGDFAYTWLEDRDGNIPVSSVEAGHEADGQSLFVARARLHGGLHPGKIGPGFGAAKIPFGGVEVDVATYEVLFDRSRWVAASGGRVPVGAVVAGHEVDGAPLFVARARLEGGLHPGKVRPEFGGAHIGFGGREVQGVTEYEVLVEGVP